MGEITVIFFCSFFDNLLYYQWVIHLGVYVEIFISILLIFVSSLAHCEELLEQTMLKLDTGLFDSFNK